MVEINYRLFKLSVECHYFHYIYHGNVNRYSDGELTMIYLHGDKCSNGFRRNTVIKFQCNKTIGEKKSADICINNYVYAFQFLF